MSSTDGHDCHSCYFAQENLECHRSPPVLVLAQYVPEQPAYPEWKYPPVNTYGNWCGEWKPCDWNPESC